MDILHALLLVGIGLTVGFIGTLIGAGGGFILVPILLILYPKLGPEIITSISLAIVFLNACSGSIAYAKMKRIDYKSALAFSLATLPGAILGAYLVNDIPEKFFDILLGLILVSIAVFLLIKPGFTKKPGNNNKHRTSRSITDNHGNRYEYSFKNSIGIISSFFVGFLSSLLGIGGGIIHVPVLTSLLNFPIHVATATSHFVLTVMALAGTVTHIIQGNLDGQWFKVLYLGAGVVAGAQAGAAFSHHAKPRWIIQALAFALLLVGIRMLLRSYN